MAEAPSISARPAKKTIAIFLDGTWNAIGDNTNVWRLKSLCANKANDGASQVIYYDAGVNGFWGGTFGKGLIANVQDAYKWLVDEYEPGDDIFIFGFSRGAYTARSLAGFITKCGLLQRGAALSVNQLFDRYRRSDETTVWKLVSDLEAGTLVAPTLEERWLCRYSQRVPVKMLGIWDTVGALGIPLLKIPGVSRATLGFLHTGLRVSIENGYHALAIDEHRKTFAPTLWTTRRPREPGAVVAAARPITSVEQRWFVGAHANVGGGCVSDLLAQTPLRWIMTKASQHGLAFRNDVELEKEALTAAISDSYAEFLGGTYSKLTHRHHRTIGANPIEKLDGTHSNVNETIDASVFERWSSTADYRPPSLSEWAQRRGAQLNSIRGSVRADDPTAAAPD